MHSDDDPDRRPGPPWFEDLARPDHDADDARDAHEMHYADRAVSDPDASDPDWYAATRALKPDDDDKETHRYREKRGDHVDRLALDPRAALKRSHGRSITTRQ